MTTATRATTKGWSIEDAVAHIVKRCRSLSKPPRAVVQDEMAFLWPRLREAAIRELVATALAGRANGLFNHAATGDISPERLSWAVKSSLTGAEVAVERLNLNVDGRLVNGLDASAADYRKAAANNRHCAEGLQRAADGHDQIAAYLDEHEVRCARDLPQKGRELNKLVETYWMDGVDD